ncbi:Exostosin-like 3 [Strongyloides ratti]|uniref:Exostosin-like 3 n=1 Tax=Strongyloides ratti TaxID=34506 RepID=A0A090L6S7_STRRB|nr:Exostosin-like 3 [Strongyloides ratti]CEF63813.1 Exostosin-like 3 [Strongyloides ratti]
MFLSFTLTKCLFLIITILLIIPFLLLKLLNLDEDTSFYFLRKAKLSKDIKHNWKWGDKCFIQSENNRILISIQKELIETSKNLEKVNKEIENIDKLLISKKEELDILEQQIEEAKLLQKELNDRRNVKISLPLKPLYPDYNRLIFKEKKLESDFDTIEKVFDFSRCSISNDVKLYYNETIKNLYRTDDPYKACVFITFISKNIKDIKMLKYWMNNGRNHIIVDIEDSKIDYREAALVVGRDIINYRKGVDFFTFFPTIKNMDKINLVPLLPHSRKFLISFSVNKNYIDDYRKKLLENLKKSAIASEDFILIDYNCAFSNEEWAKYGLCGDRSFRIDILKRTVFTLIFPDPESYSIRIEEALLSGSIPVILSMTDPLPFDDVIDWRTAAIRIPFNRFPELHFILKSINLADILEFRRKGRFYLENYLLSPSSIIETIISSLRYRTLSLGLPSLEIKAKPLFGNLFVSPSQSPVPKPQMEEEYLGPIEASFGSPSYTHNFTSFSLYSYDLWNNFPHLVHNTPSYLINHAIMPSESEFYDETNSGFRPILPGSGVEFSKALGGNRNREQFTVVILTYNRDQILYSALERLHQIPYLNKIIVIWNSIDRKPSNNWPHLHVPIVFINATKNSLNNRFYPYDQIETEAVFSMDDDIDIKQHEIIFAFRVWREQRNKIVGFPARHHAKYGDSMFYNSNHTCQLSMILTGASFIHKSYFIAYTFTMPKQIREKVDEFMNCEDIAMNFLVSHLTRQPPIKTTSKWTLRCPNCPETLSSDESHFTERHECIRFFTKIYGYNPLLFTQFRVDSVLFKTRLPLNHQKCFRYV